LEQQRVIPDILERGIQLNIHGQEHRILHPILFSNIQDALTYAPYDLAIFALKSYDTQDALEVIRPYTHEFPTVLCLQNGVENEVSLASVLGTERVIAGTVTSSVRRRGPGDIFLERDRGIGIAVGHPLSTKVANTLSESRFNVHQYSSAASMKWSKMLTNLLGNSSSAILDMKPSEIFSNPQLFSIEVTQLREAINVCQALQIPIVDLPGTPVRLFTWLVNKLPSIISRLFISSFAGKGRGEKMPSFHIDLHSGRGKSEVDYLNGAVVRFGERSKVPTPVNRWLTQTLLDLTHGNLPIEEYKNQTDKYLAHIANFTKREMGKFSANRSVK
jgi:2-dehydropantoate 2-reductase